MTTSTHRFTAHLEDDDDVVAAANDEAELLGLLRRHVRGTHHHVIHTEAYTGRIEFEVADGFDGGVDVDTVVYLVDEDPDWPVQ
jgi:hypothetical protein